MSLKYSEMELLKGKLFEHLKSEKPATSLEAARYLINIAALTKESITS